MWGLGRLQVHEICSRRLLCREVVETHQITRELGMFDKYYIDHKTFNIIAILYFNQIKFCDSAKVATLLTKKKYFE